LQGAVPHVLLYVINEFRPHIGTTIPNIALFAKLKI
jgi:hypothetical protein